jgi:hypothetical protein
MQDIKIEEKYERFLLKSGNNFKIIFDKSLMSKEDDFITNYCNKGYESHDYPDEKFFYFKQCYYQNFCEYIDEKIENGNVSLLKFSESISNLNSRLNILEKKIDDILSKFK